MSDIYSFIFDIYVEILIYLINTNNLKALKNKF